MARPEKGQKCLRGGRVSLPDVDYFVTACIEERQPLLRAERSRRVLHDSLTYCEASGLIVWHCYTTMPDHIHALFKLRDLKTLSQFIESFKKWTSRRIDGLSCRSPLQRTTPRPRARRCSVDQGSGSTTALHRALESPPTSVSKVWQDGFFDHGIRSEQDFDETVLYIFLNPVEDGLATEPWSWPGFRAKPEIDEWLRRWQAEEKRIDQ